MPSLSRLLIPIVLGLAAGAINYWVVSNTKEYTYLAAKTEIAGGEVIESKMLGSLRSSIRIPAAIPVGEMAAIEGRAAGRRYLAGDLILRQDLVAERGIALDPAAGEIAVNVSLDGVQFEPKLLRVGTRVGFVVPATSPQGRAVGGEFHVLGPYRIVAVGSLTAPATSQDKQRGRTITVAVQARNTAPDVDALMQSGARLIQAKANREIIALALYPQQGGSAAADTVSVNRP